MIINTSLTLIGFGFTINEVFGDAAGRGVIVRADWVGRVVGLSLLTTGLILLALGIHQHAISIRHLTGQSERVFRRFRRRTSGRYYNSSIFPVAVLLLAVGVLTFGVVLFGIIYRRLTDGAF